MQHRPFGRSFLILLIALASFPFLPGGVRFTTGEPQALAAPPVVAVAQRFSTYYNTNQGPRVLGNPLSETLYLYSYPVQYFEKGRIEDHRGESGNPAWVFAYGRLTAELMEATPNASVSTTNRTYADLRSASASNKRVTPPTGFKNGTMPTAGGTFVPFDAGLGAAPGYVVPDYFWAYINRTDLFPGGWLHDIGLPMTGVLTATVVKGTQTREITLQAFERSVLSFDPQNPADFRVERGNIGADALGQAERLGANASAAIQLPTPGMRSTLPVHIVARFKGEDAFIDAELRWADGTVFTNTLTVLRDDGDAIVVESINWLIESEPPRPKAPQATLTLLRKSGEVLASQQITVLHYDSPETQLVQLYWIDDNLNLEPTAAVVPRTPAIGKAALEELLWGIDPASLAGFNTALPTPAEVLDPARRQPAWGPRVTLRKLTIENGIALADFSQEINAYGGGSARVGAIYGQIEATLKQFPSVREVRVAVEGETEAVLQP